MLVGPLGLLGLKRFRLQRVIGFGSEAKLPGAVCFAVFAHRAGLADAAVQEAAHGTPGFRV